MLYTILACWYAVNCQKATVYHSYPCLPLFHSIRIKRLERRKGGEELEQDDEEGKQDREEGNSTIR